ncbi:myosin-4-like [Papilio machaon]|uniref:myosin-4-like n=1 Tax=Papilio machaon TaxID=76193 RepID=UPI001E6657C5|nr:myosin-4-like [Papilio machaon]
MAEVHMQHEAANAEYQEELRHRPEILNKLSFTRKICDVLQESSERLQETLSRCKADGATLYTAFNSSAEQLREMRHKQVQQDEKVKHQVEGLQEKVSLSSNHSSELVEYLTSAKQQVDGELTEVRAQLATANARNNDLLTALGDSNREIDSHKYETDRKDDMITHLQREMKRHEDEYNIQTSNANKTLAQKDKEIQEAIDAVQSLKQALMNQEQFIKSVSDERNSLQEKVADLEEEQQRLVAAMESLKMQMQDTNSARACVEENLNKALNENNDLKKENFDYVQEMEDLQMQINLLEKDKTQINDELQQSKKDSNEKFAQIQQLVTEKKQLEDHIEEIKNNAKAYQEIAEGKQKDLDNEIDTKVNAINCLMSEVKTATDVKFKLAKVKKEMELERDAMKEKEEKSKKEIKKLQDSVRVKEAELTQNMSMILELRSEKGRLQQTIQDMQKTDNVEKKLTGRRWPPPKEHFVLELDDNAVMMTPPRAVGFNTYTAALIVVN